MGFKGFGGFGFSLSLFCTIPPWLATAFLLCSGAVVYSLAAVARKANESHEHASEASLLKLIYSHLHLHRKEDASLPLSRRLGSRVLDTKQVNIQSLSLLCKWEGAYT